MGLLNNVTKGVSKAALSAGATAARGTAQKKAELELANLSNRYDEFYLVIGKRIAEFFRNGEEIKDPKVKQAFERIVKFDMQKAELEARIRELKGESVELTEAGRLVAAEEVVEKEIAKCKELLDMGVDTQEEYDRKVATFRNKMTNFKQLEALEKAFSKKLLSEDEYKIKKSALIGQDVVN